MNVTDCPLLIVGFDGLIVGVDRTGATTVRVPVFTLFVVSGDVALSVMNTFAARVFPATTFGSVTLAGCSASITTPSNSIVDVSSISCEAH